jgi:hypothetical protein
MVKLNGLPAWTSGTTLCQRPSIIFSHNGKRLHVHAVARRGGGVVV